jgi:acyl carrier protein
MMSGKTTDDLVRELAALLCNFEGREYSAPIDSETLMFEHLGLTSIDAVVLGERLEEIYGCKFPFRRFVDQLREREAADLTVGEFAAFLHSEMHVGG